MALGLNFSGINGKEGMGKKGVLNLGPLRTGCQDMDKHTMVLLKEILIRENGLSILYQVLALKLCGLNTKN